MDWNAYRTHLTGHSLGNLAALTPDTIKGVVTLNNAAEKTNRLDAKTRELIALAVAITTRCDGCITIHAAEAEKAGATKEEIAEALGVAIALNAGAATIYATRVMDALEALKKPG